MNDQEKINNNDDSAAALVGRIRNGDSHAEGELFRRYYRGVVFILRQRTRDHALAEDLAQDTLLTVLNRLRGEGIQQPEMLNRFIQRTAKFIYIGWMRKRDNQTEYREYVDDALTDELSLEGQIEREETRLLIRELIESIKVPRDREILFRYYVRDQEKAAICDALELSDQHFDTVINRARNRFRQLAARRLVYE